jgi:hypothetical protein
MYVRLTSQNLYYVKWNTRRTIEKSNNSIVPIGTDIARATCKVECSRQPLTNVKDGYRGTDVLEVAIWSRSCLTSFDVSHSLQVY